MLVERISRKKVPVVFREIKLSELSLFKVFKKDGWKFTWKNEFKKGLRVYALFVNGNLKVIQGLIAMKPDPRPGFMFIDVGAIEAAPHNKMENKNRIYTGVGKHLLAFACNESLRHGFDGYVNFTAKTNLIPYYKKMGAIQKGNSAEMYFNTSGALKLVIDCEIKGGVGK